MSLTDFRNAIKDELEKDLGIPFVSRKIEGPVEDRTVGCLWISGTAEDEGNVDIETITMQIRVFRQWEISEGAGAFSDDPVIPELEDWKLTLQTALRDIQATAAGTIWFFRVISVDIDVETYMVEATVMGKQANPFVVL